MRNLWRLCKAAVMAVVLLSALVIAIVLFLWTKGLLMLIIAFAALVNYIYRRIERREWERDWRARAARWREYK